jgi:hypothetical protein
MQRHVGVLMVSGKPSTVRFCAMFRLCAVLHDEIEMGMRLLGIDDIKEINANFIDTSHL